METHSKHFGNKEHILNYTCQFYQLSRPSKVGAVMALIRECQPASYDEWKQWYFQNAHTAGRVPVKLSEQSLTELGERLYEKLQQFVIPSWQQTFRELTLQDCIDYIYNLTINRTYDGYLREKSVVTGALAALFPSLAFEESDPHTDHAGDIDYLVHVGSHALGLQVKPVTANANFGGFSLSECMKASFDAFTQRYGGKVFVIYSQRGEIANTEVIAQMKAEVERLEALAQ